jgi:hypothetical protein
MSDLPDHHGGECHVCEGTGVDFNQCSDEVHDTGSEHEQTCPDCPECEACEGHGAVFWDWDPEETDGYCSDCKDEGLDVMGYGEDGEEGSVCLPCYLRWHATQCGCGAWPLEAP